MTEETCKQGVQVERLDYSRPPPGYEIVWSRREGDFGVAVGHWWRAGRLWSSEPHGEECLTIAAAWAHYKAESDPPGLQTWEGHDDAYWRFGVEREGVSRPGAFGEQSEARAAAWAWHDRRHALMRMFEQAAEVVDSVALSLDHEVLAWPDVLTWSDEAVASSEREVAAMIHRHAEAKVETLFAEPPPEKRGRKTILEWAREAKQTAEAGDCDPMPRDASFIRAAVTFDMLTRHPMPYMQLADDRTGDEVFARSSAIVMMAINFDDHDQPSTPQRAALFAEVLDV